MNPLDWYDHFSSDQGFGDGDEVPAEAQEVRNLMVEALNTALGPDSPVTAVAFDQGRFHNPCRIYWVKRNTQEEVPAPDGIYDLLENMDEHELIEHCIKVKVERSPDAAQQLEAWVRLYRQSQETP